MDVQILYDKRSLIIREHPPFLQDSFEPRNYLVLGDLHVGFEEKFNVSGVKIQSNYHNMAQEIIRIVEEYGITDIILNGDIKSGTDRILNSEWENVPKFLSTISDKRHIFIIPGNHDGGLSRLIPKNVEMVDMDGLCINNNLIIHGHTRPLAKYANSSKLILGHVHPIFQRKGSPLSGQPVWVFAKVPRKAIFKDSLLGSETSSLIEVIVVPSFNQDLTSAGYASEMTGEEKRASPLVKEIRLADDAMIATLQGEIIGDSTMLTNVL